MKFEEEFKEDIDIAGAFFPDVNVMSVDKVKHNFTSNKKIKDSVKKIKDFYDSEEYEGKIHWANLLLKELLEQD